MELETIKVRTRVRTGKGGARQVRREGDVPSTLYGGEGGPVDLRIELRQISNLVHGEWGEHAIVHMEVEDKPEASHSAILRDVQHHPVRGTITHADFLRIDLDTPIDTVVPVIPIGRAAGVIEGGILDHQLREIHVRCLPLDVPKAIEVDVTELELGQNLHVSDIVPPENVEFLTPARYAVVAVLQSRLTRTAEDTAAGAALEGEEGEEATEESGGDED